MEFAVQSVSILRQKISQILLGGFLAIGCGLAAADTQLLWTQFYANEQHNDIAAEQILLQIIEGAPNDLQALKSMLYLKIRQAQPELALEAADKVLHVAPDDEPVRLQKAYLLNQLGRNAQAHAQFKLLENAKDAKIAATACQAAQNLHFAVVTRIVPAPYFADLYASPSYESRSDAAVLPLKLRAGRYFGVEQRGQVYGFVTANRDSQSRGGVRPEIVDENALTLGMGVNYRFGTSLPVTAYLEVGASRDLIERNRAKNRESVVAGLTTFLEWGDTAAFCGQGCSFPQTFHADFYGNIATYSREDYNFIADLRLRPGLNFLKNEWGVGRAYWKLRSSHDSKGEFFNNVFETGPGLSFDFVPELNLSLRVEAVKAVYLRGKPASGRSGYYNRRVELTYFRSF